MTEEIRYDFKEFRKHADNFIHDLIKLMVVSKMNSTLKNTLAKDYFESLTKQISGCDLYVVKYGQPILYIKYKGMEFTDQKITSYFIRLNDHAVDVTVESVFEDFVKTFGEHRNGNYYLINSRILTKYLNYSVFLAKSKEIKTTKGGEKLFNRNEYNEARIG